MFLKIGELARRTGLTVRALRHYGDIGLLTPSARSEGRYRLYGREDVARLYRIQALRRLDISLTNIVAILDKEAGGLSEVVAQQLTRLDHQIRQANTLRAHLAELQKQLSSNTEPGLDDWLVALESMVAGNKYFSDEEMASLSTQRSTLAETRQTEKAALAATLRNMLDTGVSPDSAQGMALARRWIELLLEEAGGDEGVLIKIYTMHWHEPALHALTGVHQAGMQFISHAMAYNRLELYAGYCNDHDIKRLRQHYVQQTDAWPPLIAAIREHMSRGAAPDSTDMQVLARRWQAISLAKACGDPQLQIKLQRAFQNEAALRLGSGIDLPLTSYVNQAIRQLESPLAL
ncbi:MerR family transcriptional regulator [Polaromonas sp. SM01]|uniref:MerR family transcriptional regulator n=1 Tax=Polaromonas sp. SM01 TaxID=3085630 RepID=UPI002982A85D|nr:MerR family transcriptional regulator [Polaromonas sp. SM01]MDW5443659.1 MerR family transcriptional regulator [Polaromonas sp. SM01]